MAINGDGNQWRSFSLPSYFLELSKELSKIPIAEMSKELLKISIAEMTKELSKIPIAEIRGN